jgi:general secretion pathway protein A
MYQDFFGLTEPPFELTSNPRFLFLPQGHREALTNLEYGLSFGKAITLLLGLAGTGKTTLLHAALASDRCRHVTCVLVRNPMLNRGEFVQTIAREFGLGEAAAMSKSTLLTELECLLRERRARGQICALVVDEAQSLGDDLLEEIRLLTNIETADEKLLPLVLAGQPEFGTRLDEPGLLQFKQRVALRCEVSALDLNETARYIAVRIRTAGGDAARLFSREAIALIHEYSRGIPRTINVICDNSLVSGFAVGRQPVGRDIVLEVCRDFRLRGGKDTGVGEKRPLENAHPRVVAEPSKPTAVAVHSPTNSTSSESSDEARADKKKSDPFTRLGISGR